MPIQSLAGSCKLHPLLPEQDQRGLAVGQPLSPSLHTSSLGTSAATTAVSEDDAYQWAKCVLCHLCGVSTTATTAVETSMELSFSSRVGSAFPASGFSSTWKRQEQSPAPHSSEVATSLPAVLSSSTQVMNASPDAAIFEAPVVLLYSDESVLAAEVAFRLQKFATARNARGATAELTEFQRTGFPRPGTFVLIILGYCSRGLSRVFRQLSSLKRAGTVLGNRVRCLA